MRFFFLFALMVGVLYIGGWLDFNENAAINHCLDMGKVWKDGKCV